MRDNIPDALITAFERQYDSSWNDPQLRKERLAMRYGWAAAMEAKPCLHQIQEPAPATAMDALREAEAALEVAMARILKADPGHSIRVTSEAKALVAVRAALAAPAAVAVPDGWKLVPELPTQDMCESAKYGIDARLSVFKWADGYKAMLSSAPEFAALAATPAAAPVVLPEPVATLEVTESADTLLLVRPCRVNTSGLHKLYTEQQVRALLATGGQAQAVQPITGPCGQCKSSIQPCDCAISTILKERGLVAVDATHYSKVSAQAKAAAPQAQADARDAEQERWMGIGKAIERACVDLPAGAEINIHLEKDAGTVTLSDCDGDEQENFPTDEGLAGVVNAAIDAAIAAAKGR